MKGLHAIQQANRTQRAFLNEIVTTAWPGESCRFSTFRELARASRDRPFDLVFLELDPGDSARLEWIETWGARSVGLVSRRVDGGRLDPFLERGLSDYILKPYQPDKITSLVRARRRRSD